MRRRHALPLLAALAMCVPALAAPRITPPAIPEAEPGAYVTLPLRLRGSGEIAITLEPAPGWLLVTNPATRTLEDGVESVLFVTLKAPDDAPPGPQAAVTVVVWDADGNEAVAAPTVRVRARAALRWTAPRRTAAALPGVTRVETTVENVGNVPLRLALEPERPTWPTVLDPASLELAPGETTPVTMTLRPPENTRDGFRYLWRAVARSENGAVEAGASGIVEFSRTGAEHDRDPAPRLTFSVRLRADASVRHDASGTAADLRWSVAPALAGGLSDSVRGRIEPDGWTGTLHDPFASLPDAAQATLWGDDWSVAVRGGVDGLSVSASRTDGVLQYGGGLSYRATQGGPSYAAHAALGTQLPGVRLDGSATARLDPTAHVETVRIAARGPLADGVTASASVSGIGGPTSDAGYRVIPHLTAGLQVSAAGVSGQSTYQSYPTLAEHAFRVTVDAAPLDAALDVRGFAQVALHGQGATPVEVRAGAAAAASPLPGLSVSLAGSYLSTTGERAGSSWTVAPRLAWRGALAPGWDAAAGASYQHTQPIAGAALAGDLWSLDASLTRTPVQLEVGVAHRYRGGAPGTTPLDRLEVSAQVDWDVSFDTSLTAGYDLTLDTRPVEVTRHTFRVSWDQRWPFGIDSTLSVDHGIVRLPAGNTLTPDRLALAATVPLAADYGVSLGLAYRVSAPEGAFAADATFAHQLRLGVGVTLQGSFDTPDAVVDAFGGRSLARVEGRVFLDANGDGRFGPGDTAVAGVGVALGDGESASDADGRYLLTVPPGPYRAELAFGVPAGWGLPEPPAVEAARNARLSLDLPLVPVTTVTATVFDDRDRDGVRGPGESGIAYARVHLEGAVAWDAIADATGTVRFRSVPQGRYRLAPTPDGLPDGYRVTGAPGALEVRPTAGPVRIDIGAARPPRRIVTTFSSGDLSVFASARARTVPAGGELPVVARVTGEASAVWAEVAGVRVPFAIDPASGDAGAWLGDLPIPASMTPGTTSFEIFAQGGGEPVSASLRVRVTDDPLAGGREVRAFPGETRRLLVTTAVRAAAVTLTLPDGTTVALDTTDGRSWGADAAAPDAAGRYDLPITVDGQVQGTLALTVEAR